MEPSRAGRAAARGRSRGRGRGRRRTGEAVDVDVGAVGVLCTVNGTGRAPKNSKEASLVIIQTTVVLAMPRPSLGTTGPRLLQRNADRRRKYERDRWALLSELGSGTDLFLLGEHPE
jgi:hypothetical protein